MVEVEPINIVCIDKKSIAREELTKLLEEQKEMKKGVKELCKQNKEKVEFIVRNADYAQSLVDCKDGDILEIRGAVERKTRYGQTFIMVDSNATGYWANTAAKSFLAKLKPTVIHKGYGVVCNTFNLKVLGHRWTSSRHRHVETKICGFADTEVAPTPKLLPRRNNLGKPKDYRN